jgi:hypothetical protein
MALMTPDRHWPAILRRPGLEARDDRHPITTAVAEGITARSTT